MQVPAKMESRMTRGLSRWSEHYRTIRPLGSVSAAAELQTRRSKTPLCSVSVQTTNTFTTEEEPAVSSEDSSWNKHYVSFCAVKYIQTFIFYQCGEGCNVGLSSYNVVPIRITEIILHLSPSLPGLRCVAATCEHKTKIQTFDFDSSPAGLFRMSKWSRTMQLQASFPSELEETSWNQ